MIIGSHSESHTLLSKLSYKKQLIELKNSKIILEKTINKKIDTFCYPYGRKYLIIQYFKNFKKN